jgi:hypothetical protein
MLAWRRGLRHAGFPVSPGAQPEAGQAPAMSAGSGLTSATAFAKWDRGSCYGECASPYFQRRIGRRSRRLGRSRVRWSGSCFPRHDVGASHKRDRLFLWPTDDERFDGRGRSQSPRQQSAQGRESDGRRALREFRKRSARRTIPPSACGARRIPRTTVVRAIFKPRWARAIR